MYVVVDEIVDEWVGLSVTGWPNADQEGRLRFTEPKGAVEVGTSLRALRHFLQGQVAGSGDDASEPRIGTTFAARSRVARATDLLDKLRKRGTHGKVRVSNLGEFLERPVDLTIQGRRLARLAYYGAVMATMPSRLERHWRLGDEIENY